MSVGARGRLIFPFLVELAQLDTAATEADPDAGGALVSGYNEHFREPVKVLADPADQVGVSARQESTIQVYAQIEPAMFEKLQAMLGGDSPESRFAIVCHFRDLENAGLVDGTTGKPLIYKGDRLAAIYTTAGVLVETIPNPPGLFVHEVQSRGFGPGGARNLLLVNFEQRDTSTEGA